MAEQTKNVGEISSEELGLILAQKIAEANIIQKELEARLQRHAAAEKELNNNDTGKT